MNTNEINVPCKTDPDAPHGFDRNASHTQDRYVCDCESWREPTLSSILRWHQTARPNPTDKDRSISLGVHFEEVGEMFDAIGEPGHAESMTVVSGYYKQNRRGVHADKLALLDALCDQIATALGVAQAYQFDIQGALAEVNRSNWSKFVDGLPIKDANGKISKPLGYSKPELSQFIRRYPESENEGSEP